jgi:hypothetical protein
LPDVITLALPVAAGGGIAVRAITKAEDVVGVVGVAKKAEKIEKGWKLGDPVNKLTRAGKYPHWNTVKARYWKNEALRHPEKYSPENLARMRKGLAPKSKLGESKELHHKYGRDILDPHNPKYLEEVWPREHFDIHYGR